MTSGPSLFEVHFKIRMGRIAEEVSVILTEEKCDEVDIRNHTVRLGSKNFASGEIQRSRIEHQLRKRKASKTKEDPDAQRILIGQIVEEVQKIANKKIRYTA